MNTKTFHVGDLLSISTGLLVSSDHMDGVYNILGHMTEDTLWTHQLPLAADAMRPELLTQHPWLKTVEKPEGGLSGEAECVAWVAAVAAVHGEHHEVKSAPLAWGTHHPITDFQNEYPDKPILTVHVDGDVA